MILAAANPPTGRSAGSGGSDRTADGSFALICGTAVATRSRSTRRSVVDDGNASVTSDTIRPARESLHPVHAVLLASIFPLALGALAADWAYVRTFEVQWINFAAWLNAGALIFNGGALLWAAIDALRADLPGGRGRFIYPFLLVAALVLGFVNALAHAKDAWATMPLAIILSAIVLLIVLAAIWAGFAASRTEPRR